ncbi:MAG: hypothetical protein OEZ34_07310 [Spirochaetia bacterium]|nr:hypothetical protein [Spirochaetia bacterium]
MNKVNVRWAVFLFTILYLYSLYFTGSRGFAELFEDFNFRFISLTAATVIVCNFIYNLILIRLKNKDQYIHPSMKYASMIFDLFIVTLLLIPTGGRESMFFLLYIVVMLSNGMRYGMRLAVIGILIFNIFYVLFLLYQFYPSLEIKGMNSEILKVIGVWVVGLYIGYLSRRFQILQNDVDKYRNLLKKHLENASSESNQN